MLKKKRRGFAPTWKIEFGIGEDILSYKQHLTNKKLCEIGYSIFIEFYLKICEKEVPYTEPYVWCRGRSVDKTIIYLLPDKKRVTILVQLHGNAWRNCLNPELGTFHAVCCVTNQCRAKWGRGGHLLINTEVTLIYYDYYIFVLWDGTVGSVESAF